MEIDMQLTMNTDKTQAMGIDETSFSPKKAKRGLKDIHDFP
jgi:hypothetical protein